MRPSKEKAIERPKVQSKRVWASITHAPAKVIDTVVWPRFREVVQAALPEAKESLMTIAEELEQRGVQRGLQQGLQQGERALLVKLLTKKFGNLEPNVLQRVQSADQATFDRYSERILTARTLDEVFAGEA